MREGCRERMDPVEPVLPVPKANAWHGLVARAFVWPRPNSSGQGTLSSFIRPLPECSCPLTDLSIEPGFFLFPSSSSPSILSLSFSLIAASFYQCIFLVVRGCKR